MQRLVWETVQGLLLQHCSKCLGSILTVLRSKNQSHFCAVMQAASPGWSNNSSTQVDSKWPLAIAKKNHRDSPKRKICHQWAYYSRGCLCNLLAAPHHKRGLISYKYSSFHGERMNNVWPITAMDWTMCQQQIRGVMTPAVTSVGR